MTFNNIIKKAAQGISILVFFITFLPSIKAQEYIQNGGFEDGNIPTVLEQIGLASHWNTGCSYRVNCNGTSQLVHSTDLLDRRSDNPQIQIPESLWGITHERTNLNRYAHFQRNNKSYPCSKTHNEYLRGNLTSPLPQGEYILTFYATAGGDEPRPNHQFPDKNFVDVVLFNGWDCDSELLVYTTPSPVTLFNTWKKFETLIVIDDSQSGLFSKIGFKMNEIVIADIQQGIHIDDISLRKLECENIEDYGIFHIDKYHNDEGKISLMKFKMSNIPPSYLDLGSWWNIYEANNCDMNDLDSYNDVPLRETHYGNGFSVVTPQQGKPHLLSNKCYIVKHGVWTNSCEWTEKRMKIKLTTAITN